MVKSYEYIDRTIEIISKPGQWTKGARARNDKGEPLWDIDTPEAVSWCAVGAMEKAIRELTNFSEHTDGEEYKLFRKIYDRIGKGKIIITNDRAYSKVEDVIAALRKASNKERLLNTLTFGLRG